MGLILQYKDRILNINISKNRFNFGIGNSGILAESFSPYLSDRNKSIADGTLFLFPTYFFDPVDNNDILIQSLILYFGENLKTKRGLSQF